MKQIEPTRAEAARRHREMRERVVSTWAPFSALRRAGSDAAPAALAHHRTAQAAFLDSQTGGRA